MGLVVALSTVFSFSWASRLLFGSILAPLGFLGWIWGISIGFYSLRLIPYPSLHSNTVCAVALSLVSFFLGSIAAGLAPGTRGVRRTWREGSGCRLSRLQRRLLHGFIVIGSLGAFAGSIWYVARVVAWYGIDVILTNPRLVRSELVFPGEGFDAGRLSTYLRGLIYTSAALSGFYLRVVSPRSMWCYLPLLAAVLRDLGFLGRSDILSVSLIYAAAVYLGQRFFLGMRRVTFKQWTAVALFFALLAFAPAYFLGDLLGKHNSEAAYAYRERGGLPVPAFLIAYYNRFAGTIAALDSAMQDYPHNYLWGTATFYPVMRLLCRVGVFADSTIVDYTYDTRMVPTPMNTFTYLRYFYDDFSFPGVIAIPFVLGFFSSYLWVRLNWKPTVTSLVSLTFLYNVLFYSFSEWRFWNIFFLFAVVLGVIVSSAVDRQRKVGQPLAVQETNGSPRQMGCL